MNIVIYSDDINLLDYWEKMLSGCIYDIVDTLTSLKTIHESIIVVNYKACSNECEPFLRQLNAQNNRLLIMDRSPDFVRAKHLLAMGVKGYGNALMRDHYLLAALQTIQDGMVWLYPECTTALIQQIDNSSNKDHQQLLERLTEREKEVALLLKEGDHYKVVAQTLGITVRTVKAHAKHIYKKLDVKDRLGLALLLK